MEKYNKKSEKKKRKKKSLVDLTTIELGEPSGGGAGKTGKVVTGATPQVATGAPAGEQRETVDRGCRSQNSGDSRAEPSAN